MYGAPVFVCKKRLDIKSCFHPMHQRLLSRRGVILLGTLEDERTFCNILVQQNDLGALDRSLGLGLMTILSVHIQSQLAVAISFL